MGKWGSKKGEGERKQGEVLFLSSFFGMFRRGFTDYNLFNSRFDSQLPEPHIVALLHKALLYLVPYLVLTNSNVTFTGFSIHLISILNI